MGVSGGRLTLRGLGTLAVIAVLLLLGWGVYAQRLAPVITIAGVGRGPAAASVQLASGTEALLAQTAEHLSKLQGGASIGGFPGFEPPDDKYRRKIESGSHTPEETNYWLKEIINFLQQIVKRNLGLSLEEILAQAGLTPAQIVEFFSALRSALIVAQSLMNKGVTPATAETLEALLQILGVVPW